MTPLHSLTFCALKVLSTHGLNRDCSGHPEWVGTAEQQAALAALHEALCAFLPPLPVTEDAGKEADRG